MKTKFTTQLAPPMTAGWGGFGSGGNINPNQWADEVYGAEMTGTWLSCYMLRRFGWPNSGSDAYKNLMSWNLTTPMPGLCLHITPYLGHDTGKPPQTKAEFKKKSSFGCGNMHFGLRFSKSVGDKIHANPVRDAYLKRHEAAVWKWWKTKGIKLYAWGFGKKEGDPDELVHHFSDYSGSDKKWQGGCYGLWRRTAQMKRKGGIPQQVQMVEWWLGELIKKKHHEDHAKLPKFPKKKRKAGPTFTRFQIQVRAAVRATLKDLLCPTNVRDISFTPFGDIERHPQAAKHYHNQPNKGFFYGAGCTPAYFYSKEGQRELAKEQAEKLKKRRFDLK